MHRQVLNARQTVFEEQFALNLCVNSGGDKDVIENQNQPTGRPQTWNTSLSAAAEILGDRLLEGMQKSGHR